MQNISTIPLILYGCGGHSRSVADVALANGYIELYFIDASAKPDEKIFNHPVLSAIPSQLQARNTHHAILAIGDNHQRAACYQEVENDLNMITLVSADAYVGMEATIAKGCFIAHGAHIGPYAKIAHNCIINTHSLVEHEAVIGAHTHIAVNSTVAGRCKIGNFVMVGAGATIKDGVEICDNVVIGAGSVVVKNITEPGTYVGIPAKKL